MRGARDALKRGLMPPVLPQTKLLKNKYDLLRKEKPGMPFLSHVQGVLMYALASRSCVKRCLEIGFATGSSA